MYYSQDQKYNKILIQAIKVISIKIITAIISFQIITGLLLLLIYNCFKI